MTIPKFDDLFNNVLNLLNDDRAQHRNDLKKAVSESLDLSEAERNETMSSGRNKLNSRIHWSAEYLVQAGAISRPQRGYMQITDLGKGLLAKFPEGITLSDLRDTPGMKAWHERSVANREARLSADGDEGPNSSTAMNTDSSPLENVDEALTVLRSALAGDLLQRIRKEDPEFLERLILKLLYAMGYGASLTDLEHLGGSGDEGVDGVIHHDRLGLDKIYLQAKRYRDESTIGRPSVQAFVGALSGKGATRGVFIATTKFSRDAYEYAQRLTGQTVVLIDGDQLANLMIEHKVGVAVEQSFEILKIDENFFGDDF